MRITRAPRAVWRYVRGAPGTYIWLGVILFTTLAAHRMSPAFEEEFLRQRSTNLHELSDNPVRVLVASAMWLDGGYWLPYAGLYSVIHAPVERWLGTARWLAVAAGAHVLATLISEGALLVAIERGIAPRSAMNTLDVGVSYALCGVAAVLTYRLPGLWRYLWAAGLLALFAAPMTVTPTFTDFGHFIAVCLGLAAYPVTRGRRNPKGTAAVRAG
ncbi:rhomboid-like protein [Streptomyces sp. NPDC004539]|uniref:rhomboid-like protein n=1 Tax=Streptomyces sp. NPDC004539 TaxID=3154280 RepID=UPI0033A3E967